MDKRQIEQAMETDVLRSLTAFNAALDDLMSATYIIVSGKISRLLQTVAQSRPLYDYFYDVTHGYNFADDLNARRFRDEAGKAYIQMPKEPYELTRFVFCLLYAIDTGKMHMNLRDLLHTFYNGSDADTELRSFCAEVLSPFKTYVNRELVGGRTAPIGNRFNYATNAPFVREEGESVYDFFERAQREESEDEPPQMPELGKTPPPAPAMTLPTEPFAAQHATEKADNVPEGKRPPDELTLASLEQVTSETMGIVSRDPELGTVEREELMLVLDAFNQAVAFKERKSIRVMYIALKNTLKVTDEQHKLEDQCVNLRNLVRELGVEA